MCANWIGSSRRKNKKFCCSWRCQCGHYWTMTNGLQSVCCQGVPEVDTLALEGEPCITAHPM